MEKNWSGGILEYWSDEGIIYFKESGVLFCILFLNQIRKYLCLMGGKDRL